MIQGLISTIICFCCRLSSKKFHKVQNHYNFFGLIESMRMECWTNDQRLVKRICPLFRKDIRPWFWFSECLHFSCSLLTNRSTFLRGRNPHDEEESESNGMFFFSWGGVNIQGDSGTVSSLKCNLVPYPDSFNSFCALMLDVALFFEIYVVKFIRW